MSSSEDVDLASFQQKGARKASPAKRKRTSVSPGMFFSDDSSAQEESSKLKGKSPSRRSAGRLLVAVRVQPVINREEYVYYEPKEEVERIVREYHRKGMIMYEVKLIDGATRQVSLAIVNSARLQAQGKVPADRIHFT